MTAEVTQNEKISGGGKNGGKEELALLSVKSKKGEHKH